VTRWVVQLSFEPDAADADIDVALRSLPGQAGRNLPGSVGGGRATWDVCTDDDPVRRLDGTVLRCVDAVALVPCAGEIVVTPPPVVKRTLLLRVRADVDGAVRQQFESDLVAMPRHIASIRSWALSHVDARRSPSRWTHAWEQEYASVAGLRDDYMTSRYHWACVDRWFDPEVPGWIVERELAHVFYESAEPVIT
jgi:Stress responsive A/B Barrel Domain